MLLLFTGTKCLYNEEGTKKEHNSVNPSTESQQAICQ